MLCRAACSSSRNLVPALGVLGSRQKHTLPDLPYDYGALEPHINAQIMQLHHSKHHAAYVNNLNVVEEKYQEALKKEQYYWEPKVLREHAWPWPYVLVATRTESLPVWLLAPGERYSGNNIMDGFWCSEMREADECLGVQRRPPPLTSA